MSKIIKLVLWIAIVFAVLISAFLFWRAINMELPISERFEPSQYGDSIFPDSLDDYLAYHKQAILASQKQFGQALSEEQLLLKAPFYRKPKNCAQPNAGDSKGVLLVHGLSDSPYFMRGLAGYFQQHCFHVLAIVLPGHSTQPGDLLNKRANDWIQAYDYGFEQLRQRVSQIHVAGFSVGGSVVLSSNKTYQDAQTVWLFVPALKVQKRAIFTALVPWFDWVHPKAAWHEILPDEDPYKYESFPLVSVAQAPILSLKASHAFDQAKEKLARNQAQYFPKLFMALSYNDSTVNAEASLQWVKEWPQQKQVLLFVDKTVEAARQQQGLEPLSAMDNLSLVVDQGQSKYKTMSHTSIMIPPMDGNFGEQAWYHDCRYYFARNKDQYQQCKQGDADLIAENLPSFLEQGVVERARYNPHWSIMLDAMSDFLNRANEH